LNGRADFSYRHCLQHRTFLHPDGGAVLAKVIGDIELFQWDGGSIFIGSASAVVPVHAHQAIQVCSGQGGAIRLRAADDDPWRDYPVGIIASHQTHAMDATDVTLGFVLFVEPETREGRALTQRHLIDGFASLDRAAIAEESAELLERFIARRGNDAVVEAARNIVRKLTGGVEALVVSDERILRAVVWVNAHLNEPITLDKVAGQVFLSPGRFRHLFTEQTGMGLRPYILWRRLTRIWELTMNGTSISRAAHEAGFADAAHLTRTSKRMIGLAPSMFRVSRTPDALLQAQSLAAKH
jgi:AraC family transcriptional regulator